MAGLTARDVERAMAPQAETLTPGSSLEAVIERTDAIIQKLTQLDVANKRTSNYEIAAAILVLAREIQMLRKDLRLS
jgi:hypothetical protein